MDAITILAAGREVVRDKISVLHSCSGVEFQPLGTAPFGEIVRVYVHTENPNALSLETLLASLSSHKPLRVGPMEFVTVLEHRAELKHHSRTHHV